VQKVHAYYEELIDNRDLFQRLYIIHYEDNIDKYKRRMAAANIEICRQYTEIT
jgi:hypothetical protein